MPELWEQLTALDSHYFAVREAIFASDPVKEYRAGLSHPNAWSATLRALLDQQVWIIDGVADLVLETASYTHGNLDFSRTLMTKTSTRWRTEVLPTALMDLMERTDQVANGEADTDVYERLAELFHHMNRPDLLTVVLDRAREKFPDDPDIIDFLEGWDAKACTSSEQGLEG